MRHLITCTAVTALMLIGLPSPKTLAGTAATPAAADSHLVDGSTLSSAAVIGDSSASYRMNWAAGEVGVSEGQSPSYRLSVGFWTGCTCAFQADLDANGSIDAVDLALLIDVVFFSAIDPTDPDCPRTRADFNNDSAADAVDLAAIIDHIFFGGAGPGDPCAP